ncbi:Uncharacterized protein dnm_099920 [Desulfonema magnum]|uniref:Uncharacterized protein n=1 Tax=Desulfonema magnum TaxID=45655 RepID=A0A975GU76_9BACT|nr:Uncharacterized protein dnm_099920 [Desulfonema magnum]
MRQIRIFSDTHLIRGITAFISETGTLPQNLNYKIVQHDPFLPWPRIMTIFFLKPDFE